MGGSWPTGGYHAKKKQLRDLNAENIKFRYSATERGWGGVDVSTLHWIQNKNCYTLKIES